MIYELKYYFHIPKLQQGKPVINIALQDNFIKYGLNISSQSKIVEYFFINFYFAMVTVLP